MRKSHLFKHQRIIFSERIPDPVIRHQDSLQVRVVIELHPEHIVYFPFVPVGCLPYRGDGIDPGVLFRHSRLDPDAVPMEGRDEIIDNLESRILFRMVVNTTEVLKVVEKPPEPAEKKPAPRPG